ncbi:polymorphic toxin-type HINT domain-containing protein, partial [Leptospira noguchii]|uniref:polymorphic toxin-type HINT domain-containing protein n=1 Tax=Leptospira noguchii TaxID=28182 RepID=UPI0009E567EF
PPLTTRSEWVKVEDLRLRDQVLRSDGSWGTVTGIYYYNTEPTKVYNLEVEDNHTYVVGGDTLGIGYVVHNYEGSFDKGVKAVTHALKDLMGGTGLLGLGPEKPMSAEARDLYNKIGEYNDQDKKLSAERSKLITEGAVTQGKKELLAKRNEFLLSVVKDPSANDVAGISDLRKSLRDVNPSVGLNKTQMHAVETWLKKTSGENGLGGGLGLFKGGMQNVANNSGIKGLILKAASEAGSSGELAHLNEKLATNKEQQRLKAIEHEAVGAKLAKAITHDFEQLKVAASEKYYNDPKANEFANQHRTDLTKSTLSTAYIANEGKQIQATNEIKHEKLKRYGQEDKIVSGILEARKQITEGESTRLKLAQEKSATDPEYLKLNAQHEKAKNAYDSLKTTVENAIRLAPEGDKGVVQLTKTLEKVRSDVEVSHKALEKRVLLIADQIPNEQSYAGRVLMQTSQDVSRDTKYTKNLEEIAKLKTQKTSDLTNTTVGAVCSYCVDTSHVDTKISALEKQNAEIFNGYKKANEKNVTEYQKVLGAEGLKKLDALVTTTLNAKIEAGFATAYTQMKDGTFPSNSIFSENNVTPVAKHQEQPNLFNPDSQVARSVNEGSPGAKRNENGMPYQSEIDDTIAQREKQGPPGKMNADTYKEALANPFQRNPDVNTLKPNELNELGLAMTKPSLYQQGENGAMSVQGAVVLDVIRKGGKENFQMDPVLQSQSEHLTTRLIEDKAKLSQDLTNGSITQEQYSSKLKNLETAYNNSDVIVRLKEFSKIKDWIFSNKGTQQLGNEISSAICRMNTNYVQGYLNGHTQMSFGEFLINKFRNADVKFNGNSAPVYDMNGFRGFETSIVNGMDSNGNRISNDFEGRVLDPKTGKMTGMVNPIPINQLSNTIQSLKPGTYVQIWWDTNLKLDKGQIIGGKPGPNHFSLAQVGQDGLLYDLNNNGERDRRDGSAKPIKYKALINPIYGIYYNPRNLK